jgi:hypothetical protein
MRGLPEFLDLEPSQSGQVGAIKIYHTQPSTSWMVKRCAPVPGLHVKMRQVAGKRQTPDSKKKKRDKSRFKIAKETPGGEEKPVGF